MDLRTPKRPHPLRLTFILLGLALYYFAFITNPYLAVFCPAFVAVVYMLFLIIRGLLRKSYPEKFERKESNGPSA